MAVITDDYNAVDASKVAAVLKPADAAIWALQVALVGGGTAQLNFADTATRDEFFKRLADALGP